MSCVLILFHAGIQLCLPGAFSLCHVMYVCSAPCSSLIRSLRRWAASKRRLSVFVLLRLHYLPIAMPPYALRDLHSDSIVLDIMFIVLIC